MQRTFAHFNVILAYVLALPALLALLPLAWLVWRGFWEAWLMLPLYLTGLALCGAYERITRDEATRRQIVLTWLTTIGFNATVAFGGWKLASMLLGPDLKLGLLGMIVEILALLLVVLQGAVVASSVLGLLCLPFGRRPAEVAKPAGPNVSSEVPPPSA